MFFFAQIFRPQGSPEMPRRPTRRPQECPKRLTTGLLFLLLLPMFFLSLSLSPSLSLSLFLLQTKNRPIKRAPRPIPRV